ncbi:MAG: sugar ABC transporter permease [Oscillospiraceae bacterium]|nr:sugar ABC transporter permease [Oscillospiraceae bacterium]
MKLSRQLKTDLTGYVFILPNIIGFLLFTLVPMVFSLIISFTDWNYTQGFGNIQWNGGVNFVEMWGDKWFTDSLINTIVFAVTVVPLTAVLALVLAVVIDRFCFARLPIRLAMFMPYISNVVAVAIVWVMMYSPWGPFTRMVQMVGVETPPQWLGDYTWALPAIIIMTIWSGLGYSVMIYTSSISSLPRDVYEAADIDGAGEVTKFFKLTVPFLSPTTFFLVITTFITSFQVFAPIQIMTRGGPGTSTHVLVYYIYTAAFNFYRMGYAASMSWILFVILFTITLVQWRGQKKWVSY